MEMVEDKNKTARYQKNYYLKNKNRIKVYKQKYHLRKKPETEKANEIILDPKEDEPFYVCKICGNRPAKWRLFCPGCISETIESFDLRLNQIILDHCISKNEKEHNKLMRANRMFKERKRFHRRKNIT